jgi:predicted negative regulator of RcsB-dependent stress response
VDRLTRKELKTDKFALEVEHGVEFLAEHRKQVTRWGSIAAAVLVVALVVYGIMSYRAGVRDAALRAALTVQDTPVGPAQTPGQQTFPNDDAKNAAFSKALNDVIAKYANSEQGAIASYYLGTMAADKGDLATADKDLRVVLAEGNKDYASLAKLALAPVLKAEGKSKEGEDLLRSLVNNPSTFVSKEEAIIALAKYIAPEKPQEARKLLEPLRADRSAISRAALSALSEIPQK